MSSQVSSGAGLSPAMMAKDLLVAGILAAAIFGTTLGFKTETAVGGLSLEYKMGLAASSIAIVVVGRLLLWLTLWRKGRGQAVQVLSLIPYLTGLSACLKAGQKFWVLRHCCLRLFFRSCPSLTDIGLIWQF